MLEQMQQIIDDSKKHNIELLLYMEHSWGAYLGTTLYKDCRASLKKPMQLLSVFEEAGRQAETDQTFLRWYVPVTNALVVQNYLVGAVKSVTVEWGPRRHAYRDQQLYGNHLFLNVCHIEQGQMAKGKQARGASPNIIHSLDAAHLCMTVCRADFPVSTVHDSYGCLLADMPKLFKLVRETFVELHSEEVLDNVLLDIGMGHVKIELGSLDINLVLESEFAFS